MNTCDRCGAKATVYYRVTQNGHTKKMHLCADCAQHEELDLLFYPDAFFPLISSPLFVPRTPSGEAQPNTTPTQTVAPAPRPSAASLKAQLKRAVRQEDYMRAAALRDEIRALEGR